jgi:hypothetical protein
MVLVGLVGFEPTFLQLLNASPEHDLCVDVDGVGLGWIWAGKYLLLVIPFLGFFLLLLLFLQLLLLLLWGHMSIRNEELSRATPDREEISC